MEINENLMKAGVEDFQKDPLIEGLQANLKRLQEYIIDTYNLIGRRDNEAVRWMNIIKIEIAMDIIKDFFSRDPTSAELSYITGLSKRSIDSILNSEDFNLLVKSIKKRSSEMKGYKLVDIFDDKVKVPIFVKKRLGRSRVEIEHTGRPYLTYSDDENMKGLPEALAPLLMIAESVKCSNNHEQSKMMLEELKLELDKENKQMLTIIASNAIDELYLPQVLSAIAYRLFEIYALQSTSKVYSYEYKMYSDMIGRMRRLIEEYLRTLLPKERVETMKRLEEIFKEPLLEIEAIAKFKEDAVASCFKRWMEYGANSCKKCDEMIWKYYKHNGDVKELIDSIFNPIDKEVKRIIIQSVMVL